MGARVASAESQIPYDDIDVDVRRLVALLNRWPGLHTLYSCAGHGDELIVGVCEAYVCFTADDQATVRALINAIPNWGTRGACTEYQTELRHVGITLFHPGTVPDVASDALVYRLTIAGAPLYYQRAQIQAIEDVLAAAVT